MESHDEERLMYDVNTFGNNSQPNLYNVQDIDVGLQRAELVSAFNFLIPGPKMLYMFSELGYDISINNPCRICNKPALWNYHQVPQRKRLYDITSSLINLRKNYPSTFNTKDFYYSLTSKTKRLILNDSVMNANVIGNFDIWHRNVVPNFAHVGIWYDYFSSDSLIVNDKYMSLTLAPGEYRIYTDLKLNQPSVTLSEIENQDRLEGINIYPNPANDFVMIDFQHFNNFGEANFQITDMLGRILIQSAINNYEFDQVKKIDVSQLDPGVYQMQISSDGKIFNRNIIIE
jgi:hypothetical protein